MTPVSAPRDLTRLRAQCRGFLSEEQLEGHFELYQGYVRALAEIEGALETAPREPAADTFAWYSELRRREPVAYAGVVLHELYFDNLGAQRGDPSAFLRRAEADAFGSWEAAVRDLKALAQSSQGWVLITYDWRSGRLRHGLVPSEHHVGLMPNQVILVAIDCWEHAYFTDYGIRKAAYVDGVLAHLDWPTVDSRLEAARRMAAACRASREVDPTAHW